MYKTSGVEALDLFYSGDPAAFAQGVGWMTANPNSLPDAAQQMENAGSLDPGNAQSLRNGWTAPPIGHPLHSKNVERIMRHGYQRAILLAQHGNKRLETFIVTGAGSDFQVQVSNGSSAVSVFIVLPPESDGSTHAQATSWVFRIGSADSGLPEEILDDDDPPVVRVRVSGAEEAALAAESLTSA